MLPSAREDLISDVGVIGQLVSMFVRVRDFCRRQRRREGGMRRMGCRWLIDSQAAKTVREEYGQPLVVDVD